MKTDTMQLGWLREGDKFEIAGLEKSFRGLRVRRVTDCSVTADGDKRDGEEDWIPLKGFTISCGTPVRLLGSEIRKTKQEVPKIKEVSVNNSSLSAISRNNINKINNQKKGRGRPKGSKNK